MIPYVYLISWKDLDIHYCGAQYSKNCHPSNLWKSYFTSSKHVKTFRQLHGEPDHIEILKEFDNVKDAREYEELKLREFDVLNKDNWLNKNICGKYCGFNQSHSEESCKKISLSKLGKKRKPFTEEHRRKLSEASKGENNPRFGQKATKETLLKMSNSLKGINKGRKLLPFTEEHRKRISESRKGKPRSEATKLKISETMKRKKNEEKSIIN